MARKDIDMVNGPLYKSVIRFSLPILATGALAQLFHDVDMIVVGRFCGSKAVAAVGATGSLVSLMVALFLGLSGGAGILMAQSYGSGDENAIKRTVHTSIYTAFVSGIILTVLGILFAKPMLSVMGTPDDIIDDAALYLKIYFSAIIMRMINAFSSGILRAVGNSRTPALYLVIGGGLNAVFNLFFVVVCNMTVDGVAYGTVISEGFAGIMCLITVMRRKDAACFSFGGFKRYFDKKVLLNIVKIGIPSGMESSMFAFTNVLTQTNVNAFGSAVVAGGAAASTVFNLCNICVTSISSAATMFMGQNFGAGNFKRIKKLPRAFAFCDAAVLIPLSVVCFLFAPGFISLFIKEGAAKSAHAIGVAKLKILLSGLFITGLRSSYSGFLRGMGKSFSVMIISLITICGVRIATIEIGLRFVSNRPETVFWAYPISFVAAFAAMFCYYYYAVRKEKRKYEEQHKLKKAADA